MFIKNQQLPDIMKNMKTVNDLAPGDLGVIFDINAPLKIKRRLMDMGIIKGVEVEMIRTAPLGDPLEIKVHNTLVALRKNEAGFLIIEQGEKICARKRRRLRSGWKPK